MTGGVIFDDDEELFAGAFSSFLSFNALPRNSILLDPDGVVVLSVVVDDRFDDMG